METSLDPNALERIVLSAEVAALLMEGSVYGLYVALFCDSLRTLCRSMKYASNRQLLLSVAVVLFLLITSHWFLQASVFLFSTIYPSQDQHSAALFMTASTIEIILFTTTTVLADSIFTYRLFLVWGRKWPVIIFPVISMLGASIRLIVLLIVPPPFTLGLPTRLPLLLTYLTTFTTNVYITLMISFKIWRNNRVMESSGQGGLTSVIPVLIESASLYMVSLAVTTILSWTSNTVQGTPRLYTISTQPMLLPMVGITYSLLIVLVARGRDNDAMHRTAISSLAFNGHSAVSISHIPDEENVNVRDGAPPIERP